MLEFILIFTGFPEVYQTMCIHLHIPLMLLMFGIVARGCAFVCRYYDNHYQDSQRYYSFFFVGGSVFSAFFLGVIGGSLLLGMPPDFKNDPSYFTQYIAPWFNWFCLATGLFVCSLFTLISSTYLIGETHNRKFKMFFAKRALISSFAVLASAVMVLYTGQFNGETNLLTQMGKRPMSYIFLSATLILFPFLWMQLQNKKYTFPVLYWEPRCLFYLGVWLACSIRSFTGHSPSHKHWHHNPHSYIYFGH